MKLIYYPPPHFEKINGVIWTPAENSEDEDRRARLFKEAIEGARADAKAMRMEDRK